MSAVYPSLKGKRVVITGGGSGIGAAMVEAFSRQGAKVAFVDILDAESAALEASLVREASPPRYYPCDLRDLDAVKATFAAMTHDAGPADILINNAANDDRHQIEDITAESWDERINVNLRHHLFCSQAVIPAMKAAGKGVIVNFGSISWHLGLTGLILYETAKAGIEGMTKAMARELGSYGIRVTCVVPGNVKTPRQMKWYTPQEEEEIVSSQCLPGRIQPSDVAALVLFLASDDARMLTGHEYWIDAGWC